MNYESFLQEKSHLGTYDGFEPVFMPDYLFDFQKDLADWAIRKGRCAIFADCGMGKTPLQLVWAENVHRKINKPVMILTPLAVSSQTVREGEKFGIDVNLARDGKIVNGINVVNYERLHLFNSSDFGACVCDESSIMKNYNGALKSAITEFMKKLKYRLLCTATAAPNDFNELGTSSECLGELGYMDMLNRFFKNDLNNSATGRMYGNVAKWRLKGHAEDPFFRWVCSWARAIRKPSDLGYDDGDFILPELTEKNHVVETRVLLPGMLFPTVAIGFAEQREERKRTIQERCEKMAELADDGRQAIIWGHLNDECNLMEQLIEDAKQVKGGDSEDKKEQIFADFASGKLRVLITKPKIGAFGLNFQNCSHVLFFPSHSYEQYYQGIRRCWRFGQKKPVNVDLVLTEGEVAILNNLKRKAKQADEMFTNLVSLMNDSMEIKSKNIYTKKEKLPSWL